MELENIVANTVYLRARECNDKGRSKKWKSYLKLPSVEESEPLISALDISYETVCEEEPIGQAQFYKFCKENPDTKLHFEFLKALEKFQACSNDHVAAEAQNLLEEYQLLKISASSPASLVSEEVFDRVSALCRKEPSHSSFAEMYSFSRDFLRKKPYQDFLESPHFTRYVQWKALERMPFNSKIFRQYRVLGKGGFGEVCACQSKVSGQMYAMKKMEKKRIKRRKGELMALTEKRMLEQIDCRFVVSLAYAFETREFLCMVLTLMNGGDLKFHIYHVGEIGLDEERTRFYAAEIVCGLLYLHSKSIVYRDLKPENILLDDFGHVRISDLGLAYQLSPGELLKSRVGTLGYMAPEVIDHSHYGLSPDWWGMGCLIYEMITGRNPFRAHKEKITKEIVDARIREGSVVYSQKFSLEAREICERFLERDPKVRLGCVEGDDVKIKAMGFFSSISWSNLEAGLAKPPFVPDPKSVYYKDVLEIEQFSSVKGVSIDQSDDSFYREFSTGAVSIPWQNEMISQGAFDELNTDYDFPKPIKTSRSGSCRWTCFSCCCGSEK